VPTFAICMVKPVLIEDNVKWRIAKRPLLKDENDKKACLGGKIQGLE
jgi:hypothetical protein